MWRRHFASWLSRGEAVFFAGSGISMDAGLPSADLVLRATARVFLPTRQERALVLGRPMHGLAQATLSRIQPELVYESLLELTGGDERCLMLWAALDDGSTVPVPLAHRAIVEYSAAHGLPILTTNYDLLFERAAQAAGIPFETLHPSTFLASRRHRPGVARIVKLHGTLAPRRARGPPRLRGLATTMSEISATDFALAAYLRRAMEERHLVVVGYSGRDLDLFPLFRDNSRTKGAKRVCWFVGPRLGGIAERHARQLRSPLLVREYPRDAFHKLPGTAWASPAAGATAPAPARLRPLEEEMAHAFAWNAQQKTLFLGQLRQLVGDRAGAHFIFGKLLRKAHASKLDPVQRLALLRLRCQTSHNLSRFATLRRTTRKLMQESATPRGAREQAAHYGWIGRLVEAESRRMAVPFDVFARGDELQAAWRHQLEGVHRGNVRLTREVERFLSAQATRRGPLRPDSFETRRKRLSIILLHELIEHRIRTLAIKQKLAIHASGQDAGSIPKARAEVLLEEWRVIELECQQAGYALGIANCTKFAGRLATTERGLHDLTTRGLHAADLLGIATASHLIRRNAAELHLRSRNPIRVRKAQAEFHALYAEAMRTGNLLNGLKALLAIAECHRVLDGGDFPSAFQMTLRRRKAYRRGLDAILSILRSESPAWHRMVAQSLSRPE